MATKDERLGGELAELARQFLLWLGNHELPGVPGLRGSTPDHFRLYAGTYHRVDRCGFDDRVLSYIWRHWPDEVRRLAGLRLGVGHVLLIENPHEDVTLPDGRVIGSNRIVLTDKRPLDRPGALMTVQPQLGSRTADDVTMDRVRNGDFAAILSRVDLVYDDAEAGARARLRYPYLLDYTPPRRAFDGNVQDIPIPQQLEPDAGPLHDRILAQRVREFREHLHHNSTYRNRRRVAERGGDYYPKWRAKAPLDKRQRQFQPTMLSDDYLKECFTEFVMKKGDDLVLIELQSGRHLFRLLWEPQPGNPAAPATFTVQPLLTIGDVGSQPPASDDGDLPGDAGVRFPVTAVFFRAMDGADQLPNQLGFGKLDYRAGLPDEFIVDYKAFLRWYYNDPRLRYRDDKEWLDAFVDVFFGDQSYPIELSTIPVHVPDRERLFLGVLRREADQTGPGPIKDRLEELVAWCDEKDFRDRRYVLTQGMLIGQRQLIGVTPRFDVYEWNPDTEHVTVTKIEAWLTRFYFQNIAADVYRHTVGALPFITLITWGGAIVMTGGLVGVPASMTTVARSVVTKLATQVAEARSVRTPRSPHAASWSPSWSRRR